MSEVAKKSWAQRGQEAVAAQATTPIPVTTGGATPNYVLRGSNGEDREDIIAWYGYTPNKNGNPKARQLLAGEAIEGTYAGSYIDKKFNKPVYKIRTTEGLVAVNGAGGLTRPMTDVLDGSRIKIVYLGKVAMTKGQYAGTLAHTFKVYSAE